MSFRVYQEREEITESQVLSALKISEAVSNIYVSPEGNDENNGGILDPVKTITKAFSLLENFVRFTIVVMPGIYSNDMRPSTCVIPGGIYAMYFMNESSVQENQDFDIGITCPSGSTVNIYGKGTFVNSYTGGPFTGRTALKVEGGGSASILGAESILTLGAAYAIDGFETVLNVNIINSQFGCINMSAPIISGTGLRYGNINSIDAGGGADGNGGQPAININTGLDGITTSLEIFNIPKLLCRFNQPCIKLANNATTQTLNVKVTNVLAECNVTDAGKGLIDVDNTTGGANIQVSHCGLNSARACIIYSQAPAGNPVIISNSTLVAGNTQPTISSGGTPLVMVSALNVDSNPVSNNQGSVINAAVNLQDF